MNTLLRNYENRTGTELGRTDRLKILVWAVLGAALVLGAFLRLYGINFELPFVYNPDEPAFVNPAMRMLWRGTLNPGWFGHPGTTVIYANAFIYAAVLKLGMYASWFANLKEMQDYFHSDPTLFYLLPRILNATAGMAIIAATFLAARTTFSAAAAAAAALFVAVMPSQIQYAHIIRTDMFTTLFVVLAAWQAAMIVDGRPLRHYLLAGALTGLAVATKYPAILVAALVPFAHWLSGRGWIADWWKVALAGLAALAATFVASPYLFLDFDAVLRDLEREMRPTHVGATGEGFLIDLWWYIGALRTQFGLLFLGLGVAGACAVFLEQRKAGIVLLSFIVLYLPFIAGLNLRWARYVLPVLPFVAIFAAGGAAFLIQLALSHWSRFAQGALLLAFAAVTSAPLGYKAWQDDLQLMQTDTRTVARQWILKNIERGTPLVMEVYTPQLPRGAYRLFDIRGGKLVDARSPFQNSIPSTGKVGDLESFDDLKRIQYVVLGPFWQRFQREADRYPTELRNYRKLLAVSEVIYQAKPGREAGKGPHIRVLKVDQEALERQLRGEQADPGDNSRRE